MAAVDAGAAMAVVRAGGHRITAARAAVIRAVAAQDRPFTATELCQAVAAQDPSVGRATVFRTLELLEAARVVDRLQTPGRYVVRDLARRDQPSWYLLCTSCEGVADVEDTQLARAIADVSRRQAFTPLTSHVEIVGRCRSC